MSTKHASAQLFNALIRTHHITSKKKVSRLKKAAATHDCYVLLRSGGCPGIMYCEGDETGVKEWVAVVQVRLSSTMIYWYEKAVATFEYNEDMHSSGSQNECTYSLPNFDRTERTLCRRLLSHTGMMSCCQYR